MRASLRRAPAFHTRRGQRPALQRSRGCASAGASSRKRWRAGRSRRPERRVPPRSPASRPERHRVAWILVSDRPMSRIDPRAILGFGRVTSFTIRSVRVAVDDVPGGFKAVDRCRHVREASARPSQTTNDSVSSLLLAQGRDGPLARRVLSISTDLSWVTDSTPQRNAGRVAQCGGVAVLTRCATWRSSFEADPLDTRVTTVR